MINLIFVVHLGLFFFQRTCYSLCYVSLSFLYAVLVVYSEFLSLWGFLPFFQYTVFSIILLQVIYAVTGTSVEIDICTAINHNKLYESFQYMLHLVVLTVISI